MVDRARFYEWNDPETAQYYEAFCNRHARYEEANAALVSHAELASRQRILDFAAGTGRTAEVALLSLGDGRIDCVEPAEAMRDAGRQRLTDRRVLWRETMPADDVQYDRILCGAALWQLNPLDEILTQLSRRLVPGGAFVFNIPGHYLGEPDPPGGGDDPHLLSLVAALVTGNPPPLSPPPLSPSPDAVQPRLDAGVIDQGLECAGLKPERWSITVRFDQAAYRDWLKIPVLSNHLLPGLDADQRAAAIDAAYAKADRSSWRCEAWLGWTAWKPKE